MAQPYRGYVGPTATVKRLVARSTVARRLAGRGLQYLVLITGEHGFAATFEGRDEPKAAILSVVYSKAFEERLERTALNLGESLYVDIVAFKPGPLRELSEFRLKHEGPMVRVLEATYDEGAVMRQLHQITA